MNKGIGFISTEALIGMFSEDTYTRLFIPSVEDFSIRNVFYDPHRDGIGVLIESETIPWVNEGGALAWVEIHCETVVQEEEDD